MMRLINKVVFIVLGYYFVVLNISCFGRCDDENIKIVGEITGTEFRARPFNRFNDPVKGIDFTITFNLKEHHREVVSSPPPGLISTAHANSCPPIRFNFVFTNPIDSVSITSDLIFNLQAGTNITGLFKSELIESLRQSDVFRFDGRNEVDFSYYLPTIPPYSDSFQFTIQLFDSLGRVFSATTDKIYISAD